MGQLDKYVIEMGYVSGSEVLRIHIFIKVMIRPGSGVLRISNFIKYKIRPGSGVLRISNFIKYKIRFRKRSTTYQYKKWELGICGTIKDNKIVLADYRSVRHLVSYIVLHGRFVRPWGCRKLSFELYTK